MQIKIIILEYTRISKQTIGSQFVFTNQYYTYRYCHTFHFNYFYSIISFTYSYITDIHSIYKPRGHKLNDFRIFFAL